MYTAPASASITSLICACAHTNVCAPFLLTSLSPSPPPPFCICMHEQERLWRMGGERVSMRVCARAHARAHTRMHSCLGEEGARSGAQKGSMYACVYVCGWGKGGLKIKLCCIVIICYSTIVSWSHRSKQRRTLVHAAISRVEIL